MIAGDVEGLIDDTVEEGRGEGEEEESGEGDQGSGEEEDSDDNIQKKEKRKRCKPFIRYMLCVFCSFVGS